MTSIKAKLSFEEASVRQAPAETTSRVALGPGRFIANGMTVHGLLSSSLGIPAYLIVGGPEWAMTAKYNVVATAPDVSRADIGDVGLSVLEQRFSLQLSREFRRVPIYALTRVRDDGRLGPSIRQVDNCAPDPTQNSLAIGRTVIKCRPWIPGYVARGLDRPVEDRTGLTGLVDLELTWSPELTTNLTTAPAPDSAGVSLFTALREQLGLNLAPTEGDVEVLVIVRVERPSEN